MKFVGFIFLLLISGFLQAQELLKTTTTWTGEEIVYPKGKAEVTSLKLSLKEGEVSKFHCHPVPTMGYVLKGKLEVETKDGKKIIFNEGDSVVEVLRTVHRGIALEGPVELVVFYAGSVDIPHTVLPENDPEFKYCNK